MTEPRTNDPLTEPMIEQLRKLWKIGRTCSECARELTVSFPDHKPVTSSQIAGFVWRSRFRPDMLGWFASRTPGRNGKFVNLPKGNKVAPKPAAVRAKKELRDRNYELLNGHPKRTTPIVVSSERAFVPPDGIVLKEIHELTTEHCRWPYDHVEGRTVYCGEPVTYESYCGLHWTMRRKA